MIALRAPPRVHSWLAAALLLCGCGRLGFDQSLQRASVPPGDSAAEDDASAWEPGEAPNEPVPEDPDSPSPVVPPTSDAGAPAPVEDASMPVPDEPDAARPSEPDSGPVTPEPDAGAPPKDAGMQPPTDASTPEPDAGAPPRACRGVRYNNVCWYLSGSRESCRDVCRAHGGFDSRSASVVGSPDQGGSAENCSDIFRLLGFRDAVRTGARTDGAGLGCHRWDDGVLWWLKDPGFDASSSSTSAARVCGCLE